MLCETMLNELLKDFQENASVNFTQENCRINLSALQPILSSSIPHEGLSALKQHAHFLAAKYHEYIGETSKAWISYCREKDEKSRFYKEALIARRDLLKRFIEKQFVDLIALALPLENLELEEKTSSSIEEDKKAPQNGQLLPNGIPFPLNFIKSWNKDTQKFHSVNEEMLKNEFAKRSKSIGKLIKAKKEEIALVDEVIKGNKSKDLETKKPVLEAELKQLCEIEHDIQESYTLHTGNNRQVLRRHKTEKQFFDPKHLKKPDVLDKLKGLTLAIIDKRFSLDNSTQESLNLEGYSSRMLITAERVFQEAVVTLSGESNIALGIPRVKKKLWSGYSYYSGTTYSGTIGYGVVENYQVSNTLIQAEHRTSPKRQRLGDSFLPQQKSYDADIYPTLYRLCNENAENEKMIATYLIRYSKNHQTVTLEELQALNPNTVEDDVHHFNRIAFLIMGKEQAQWHSTTDNNYQLGMSVAQARALRMLETGFLRLDDVFKNNVLFGTYSQTKIVDYPGKVANACLRIDELYTAFILQRYPHDSMRFFKSQIESQTKRTVVLTRQQAREDLQYAYGGETDSDGEGYDTDLEF